MTAVVVASVILGTQARKLTTARIRLQLNAVFQTIVFVLESVIFGLIGLQLPALVNRLSGTQPDWPVQALAIAATLVVVRALWIFPLAALSRRGSDTTLSWGAPAVVSWAGARGAVPLAAALSIPLAQGASGESAERDLVLVLTIAVIVITLIVQGFTLAPLVNRTGIALTVTHLSQEQVTARAQLAKAALSYLDEIHDSETAAEFAIEELRRSWKARLARIEAHDSDDPDGRAASTAYRQLRRDLISVEAPELERLHEQGAISDSTRRRIQHKLDLEQAGLSDDM